MQTVKVHWNYFWRCCCICDLLQYMSVWSLPTDWVNVNIYVRIGLHLLIITFNYEDLQLTFAINATYVFHIILQNDINSKNQIEMSISICPWRTWLTMIVLLKIYHHVYEDFIMFLRIEFILDLWCVCCWTFPTKIRNVNFGLGSQMVTSKLNPLLFLSAYN